MTRTTVYRSLNRSDPKRETLADAYHADMDDAVLTVALEGNDATYTLTPHGAPVDVYLRGYPTDNLDDEHFGRAWRTYEVRLNDAVVEEGVLTNKRASAVSIETGAGTIEIPPGQRVTIGVYGEEADA